MVEMTDTGSSLWFRTLNGDADWSARLLCFPHAGGGASSFNAWRQSLPGWIEIVRAQLPGREDRRSTPPFLHMPDLLPCLFEQVQPLLDQPISIYGHSMGAIVGFELAREMRRRGCDPPLALFVSGRRAPQVAIRPSALMHHLPEPALALRLTELATGSGFAVPDLFGDQRYRKYYLPAIRADLTVSDAYVYHSEQPLDCPLHSFLGEADNLTRRDDWERWSEVAGGEFGRHLLPGGHFYSKAGTSCLLSKITRILARLLQRDPVVRSERSDR